MATESCVSTSASNCSEYRSSVNSAETTGRADAKAAHVPLQPPADFHTVSHFGMVGMVRVAVTGVLADGHGLPVERDVDKRAARYEGDHETVFETDRSLAQPLYVMPSWRKAYLIPPSRGDGPGSANGR